MTTKTFTDGLPEDFGHNSSLLNCSEVSGTSSAILLFARETTFDNELVIHFKIKVHCADEDNAFHHSLQRKDEIATIINKIIKSKVGNNGGLKDFIITRGSINFEGFAGGFNSFGSYLGIKAFLEDILSIIPEIIRALANYFSWFKDGTPITKETEQTTIAVGGASAVALAAFTLGGPVGLPIALGVVAYKYIKKLF